MVDKDKPTASLAAPDREAAAVSADTPPPARGRRCPICEGPLIDHGYENPHKAGAHHCNQCGACWASGMRELREGHPGPKTPEAFEAR